MIYFTRSDHLLHLYNTRMIKTLEIDLRSAEGLKRNQRSIKRKTFGVIKIDEKIRKSNLDESGGSDPTWNHKSEILVNEEVQFIFIEVFYRTGSGRDKKIGEAKIPSTDFMGKYSPEGHLNFLSYRLRDEFGDKCGIVNVSIMVKSDSTTATAMKDYGDCSTEPPLIDGYVDRIVTGVPVWGVMIQRFLNHSSVNSRNQKNV